MSTISKKVLIVLQILLFAVTNLAFLFYPIKPVFAAGNCSLETTFSNPGVPLKPGDKVSLKVNVGAGTSGTFKVAVNEGLGGPGTPYWFGWANTTPDSEGNLKENGNDLVLSIDTLNVTNIRSYIKDGNPLAVTKSGTPGSFCSPVLKYEIDAGSSTAAECTVMGPKEVNNETPITLTGTIKNLAKSHNNLFRFYPTQVKPEFYFPSFKVDLATGAFSSNIGTLNVGPNNIQLQQSNTTVAGGIGQNFFNAACPAFKIQVYSKADKPNPDTTITTLGSTDKSKIDPATQYTNCDGQPDCSKAGGQICDPKTGQKGPGGVLTAIGCVPTNPLELISGIMRFATGAGGGIALLLMIFGAFQMITSAGNPEAIKKGQEQFTSAIIGLLFIIFSTLLLKIIGVDILGLPGLG